MAELPKECTFDMLGLSAFIKLCVMGGGAYGISSSFGMF
jgi:hypothetical protein